jgi:hypothetical protein
MKTDNLVDDDNDEQQNTIIITRCLSEKCCGFYTDSLSERVLIRCQDPRHGHTNGGMIQNDNKKDLSGPSEQQKSRRRKGTIANNTRLLVDNQTEGFVRR